MLEQRLGTIPLNFTEISSWEEQSVPPAYRHALLEMLEENLESLACKWLFNAGKKIIHLAGIKVGTVEKVLSLLENYSHGDHVLAEVYEQTSESDSFFFGFALLPVAWNVSLCRPE